MREAEGHPRLPAQAGEGFTAYLHRLAEFLGHPVSAAPASRPWVRDKRSDMERLDAIFGKARIPGEEG